MDQSGWTTGFSVSRKTGEPSADFALDATDFSQMGAVVGDHATWTGPADYLNGSDYPSLDPPIDF